MLYESHQGQTFVRLAIAKAAANSIHPDEIARYAVQRWGKDTPVREFVTKAAVAAGNSGGWGSELIGQRTAASEFLDFIRPRTLLGKMNDLRRIPSNAPVLTQTGGAVAYWRTRGRATPLSRSAFERDTVPALTMSALLVQSNELLKDERAEAEALIRRDLATAAITLADNSFIDRTNAGVANEMPASVTYGAVQIASTDNLQDDLEAAIGTFSGSLETACWAMNPRLALSIGLRAGGRGVAADLGARGGSLGGLPCFTSEACDIDSDGAGDIVLLDAAGICLVDEGAEIGISKDATLEMTDNPAGNSATPMAMASHMVSLFQTDSTGLLLHRRMNWLRARETSVVTVTGCTYAAMS